MIMSSAPVLVRYTGTLQICICKSWYASIQRKTWNGTRSRTPVTLFPTLVSWYQELLEAFNHVYNHRRR